MIPVEIYAGPTVFLHQSPNQAGVGIGGQVGARVHLDPLTVGGALSVGRLQLAGALVELEGGLDLRSGEHLYHPWVGVELTALLGAYRIHTPDRPDPSTLPPLGLRAAVRPLVFGRGTVGWSFLELSVGTPLAGIGDGIALGVTPLAVSATF